MLIKKRTFQNAIKAAENLGKIKGAAGAASIIGIALFGVKAYNKRKSNNNELDVQDDEDLEVQLEEEIQEEKEIKIKAKNGRNKDKNQEGSEEQK